MIPRIILLQSATSPHEIVRRSLSELACELRCYTSLDELVPNLHETGGSVGIIVFDDSLIFSQSQLTELVSDLCMEWIAVLPRNGAHDRTMARTLSTFFSTITRYRSIGCACFTRSDTPTARLCCDASQNNPAIRSRSATG